MLNRTKKRRLHIRSIEDTKPQSPTKNTPDEKTPDAEIGELFREMRQATGLSQRQIASQLKTSIETIGFLEQGHLSALPPWSESNRVIVAYTNMLGLDPEPVLRRVMLQLPGDHAARPRTQIHQPSYDNMRANAEAIMNRVPASQTAIENPSLSVQSADGFAPPPPPGFSPGYGEMRSVPQGMSAPHGQSARRAVAKKRKTSVFVPLIQLLLLAIILGTGYLMWLAVDDPTSFEDVKSQALSRWELLAEQVQTWTKP